MGQRRHAPDRRIQRCGPGRRWIVVTDGPAVVGSVCLLLVILSPLERWTGPVLVGWVLAGVVMLGRRGERLAVRLFGGFRRLSAQDRALVAAVSYEVVRRSTLASGEVEVYVRRGA